MQGLEVQKTGSPAASVARVGEIRSLTWLRGVAALAVVFHHADIWSGQHPRPLMVGQPFVDVFFVLSGFVMALSYLDKPLSIRAFAWARFSRVYPLYAIASLAALAVAAAMTWHHSKTLPAGLGLGNVAREITLTTAMPLIWTRAIWDDPTWSISVEWWVYFLVFPILARFRTASLTISLFVGAAAVLALILGLYCMPEGAPVDRGWVAFGRAAIEFGAGFLAWRVWATDRVRVPPAATTALLLFAFVSAYAFPYLTGMEAWVLALVFPIAILGLCQSPSLGGKFLSTPPFTGLGYFHTPST